MYMYIDVVVVVSIFVSVAYLAESDVHVIGKAYLIRYLFYQAMSVYLLIMAVIL